MQCVKQAWVPGKREIYSVACYQDVPNKRCQVTNLYHNNFIQASRTGCHHQAPGHIHVHNNRVGGGASLHIYVGIKELVQLHEDGTYGEKRESIGNMNQTLRLLGKHLRTEQCVMRVGHHVDLVFIPPYSLCIDSNWLPNV